MILSSYDNRVHGKKTDWKRFKLERNLLYNFQDWDYSKVLFGLNNKVGIESTWLSFLIHLIIYFFPDPFGGHAFLTWSCNTSGSQSRYSVSKSGWRKGEEKGVRRFCSTFKTPNSQVGSKVHFLIKEERDAIRSCDNLLIIPLVLACNLAQGLTTKDAGVSNLGEYVEKKGSMWPSRRNLANHLKIWSSLAGKGITVWPNGQQWGPNVPVTWHITTSFSSS